MSEQKFNKFTEFLQRIYLTDRIPDSSIFVLNLNEVSKAVLMGFSMYKNEFYEMNLFNGVNNYRYAIDGAIYEANGKPTLLFACPNQLQSYEVLEVPKSATGYLIYIQKSCFKQIEKRTGVHFFKRECKPHYQTSEQDYQNIIFWADLMHRESILTSELKSQILQNLLATLLLKIKEVVHEEFYLLQSRPQEIIGNFINLVDHSPSLPKVSECASELSLTPKQLNAITKQVLDKTANEVIKGQFNEKAKALLLQSGLSVKEIAQNLGFKEVSNFSRFFKRLNKVSPNLFREQKGAD